MADFKSAMKKLNKLEFSSPRNYLHYNRGEKGYTVGGIYEKAHPRWMGWHIVYKALRKYGSMAKASEPLYQDTTLRKKVNGFYKHRFWDVAKLDFVDSQIIADEIFIFGVNVGMRKAIKKAQKLVGVKADGWVGAITLKALNEFDESQFSIEFDKIEIAYYHFLAYFSKKHKTLKRFYRGWVNRARFV